MTRDEILAAAKANGYDLADKKDEILLTDPAFFKAAYMGVPDMVALQTHGPCQCGGHHACEGKQPAWINRFALAAMVFDAGNDAAMVWSQIAMELQTLFPDGVFDKDKAMGFVPKMVTNFSGVISSAEVALDYAKQLGVAIEDVQAKYPAVDISPILASVQKVEDAQKTI